MKTDKLIKIISTSQQMRCLENGVVRYYYPISTGKNGMGEEENSERTPRGWHRIHSIIGQENETNSVFVGRQWTGEVYDAALAAQCPTRDWILTRILRLEGQEPGLNQGEGVDSFARYIYIHGTPDTTPLGIPGSRGCVRMRNAAIIELANWADIHTLVHIE